MTAAAFQSEYRAHIALSENFYVDDQPMDVGAIREHLVNNAIHVYEQFSQVRINTVGCEIGKAVVLQAASTWERMIRIPIPASLRDDLSPRRFRLRLAGRSTSGVAVGFRISIGSARHVSDNALRGPTTGGIDNPVAEITGLTSTTSAWLTLDKTLIVVPATDADGGRLKAGFSTAGLTEAETDEAVNELDLYVELWVFSSNPASAGYITGIKVAEFLG